MTREEAANHLEDLQVFGHELSEEDKTALNMAIEALQEKEKVIAQLEELRDDPIMHCSEDYWEGHYQAAKEAIEIVKGGEQE
jgi:hypothetical protein